jgi:hypothetical protein
MTDAPPHPPRIAVKPARAPTLRRKPKPPEPKPGGARHALRGVAEKPNK